jgi:hypothetical protein
MVSVCRQITSSTACDEQEGNVHRSDARKITIRTIKTHNMTERRGGCSSYFSEDSFKK